MKIKNHNLAIFLIILAGGSLGAYALATSTVISDAGIITPAITVGDVTITGTCTGCGGGEGDFTLYSLNLDTTIAGSSGTFATKIFVTNNGTAIFENGQTQGGIVKLDGTLLAFTQIGRTSIGNTVTSRSTTGEYLVLTVSSGTVDIYKNDAFLQSITIDLTKFRDVQSVAVGISPDGKYIGLFGNNISDTIGRVQIWEGS